MNNKTSSLLNKSKSPGIYQGYVVLAACFFIMALVYGLQNSFGVFFKPMLQEFGWTRAETSGPFALNMLLSGILGIFAGGLSDKFGPRKIISLGCFILSIGYLLSFGINHLWQLYLYFGVIVAIGQSAIYVSVITLLARWFIARRGLMSGIGISGLGFGVGLIPVIASYLIESYSWRTSFLVLGAACLVILLLCSQFLKNGPKLPELPEKEHQENMAIRRSEFSLSDAMRTRQLWMFCVAWLFYGFIAQVGLVHIVPYASDQGMPAVVAATVLTVIGIFGIIGRIGLGFIGDRFGNRTTIYLSCFIMAAVFLGLMSSGSVGMLYAFAVIFGLLFGIGVMLGPIIGEYFGLKGMGAISGAMIFGYSIGGSTGPLLAGSIFDNTGSYQMAFLACGVCGAIAGIIMWLLKPIPKA